MASSTGFHSSKTTLGAAVEAFFADRDLAPATRRAYRATYGSLIQAFGSEMPVTALTAVNLQHWLIRRWGKRSPATWNARLAASRVLIGYCQRQGWIEHDPTTSLERRRTPRDETRAIPFAALDALWSRADIGLRKKALWRMLYATAELDRSPDGRGRLSYQRAWSLFREASGGQWTLHQLRHSALTHLGEDGVSAPLLMAKSRHRDLPDALALRASGDQSGCPTHRRARPSEAWEASTTLELSRTETA